MRDDVGAEDRDGVGLEDLVERTRAEAALARDASGRLKRQGASARERAAVAKRRELAAHQRAIDLHEQAAELQERLGHPDRAAKARQHAEHARELLAQGRIEQREQEG
jgi:hypothetical protein